MAMSATVLLTACILMAAAYINVIDALTSSTLLMASRTSSTTKQPQSAIAIPKLTSEVTTAPKVTTTPRLTITPKVTTTSKVTTSPKLTTIPKNDCSIFSTNETLVQIIKNVNISGTKLIKFTLSVDGSELHCQNKEDNMMYKPLTWVRSTSRYGAKLLKLQPESDVLSLFTLNIGVANLNVPLTSHPQRCVDNLTYTEMEVKLRNLVMNNFENATVDSATLRTSENVCNQRIMNSSGTASFEYYCCGLDETKGIRCNYMKKGRWAEILWIIIMILKIAVVLFVPKLLPEAIYREKYTDKPYVLTLHPPHKLSTVVTTSRKENMITNNSVKLSDLTSMTHFHDTLSKFKDDAPKELELKQISFKTKKHRLLRSDYAPVGLFIHLVNSIVRCGIRKLDSVESCCKAKMNIPRHRNLTWYTFVRNIMTQVMFFVVIFPWIVRVCVYYKFEAEDIELRKKSADEKSFKFAFSGNFTRYLSPHHAGFIIISVILIIDNFLYLVIGKKKQDHFKSVAWQLFRSMDAVQGKDILAMLVDVCCNPLAKYGAIGLCFLIPVCILLIPGLLILLLVMVPTINVTLRLMTLPFCSLAKDINKSKRMIFFFALILFMLSFISSIFLVAEVFEFLSEICVYTMMGLIFNANTTMPYVALFLLLWVYSHTVFDAVRDKFLAFNKELNTTIADLGKDIISDKICMPESIRCNNAFLLQTDRNRELLHHTVSLITDSQDRLRLSVYRMPLFLSHRNEILIPKTFYFKACNLPFFDVPGKLCICYMKAVLEFVLIIIFLIFVLIVVRAFDDTYELPVTNRMLATISGGFVPLMLKGFFFKTHPTPLIDMSSVAFQAYLNEAITLFKQSWIVDDICVEPLNATADAAKENETNSVTTSTDGHAENAAEDLPNKSSPSLSGPERIQMVDLLVIREKLFDAVGDGIKTSKNNIPMEEKV